MMMTSPFFTHKLTCFVKTGPVSSNLNTTLLFCCTNGTGTFDLLPCSWKVFHCFFLSLYIADIDKWIKIHHMPIRFVKMKCEKKWNWMISFRHTWKPKISWRRGWDSLVETTLDCWEKCFLFMPVTCHEHYIINSHVDWWSIYDGVEFLTAVNYKHSKQ